MLKPETMEVLRENGYNSLKEYLQDLADKYDVPYSVVVSLYQLLGESELVVQDAERMDRLIQKKTKKYIIWYTVRVQKK